MGWSNKYTLRLQKQTSDVLFVTEEEILRELQDIETLRHVFTELYKNRKYKQWILESEEDKYYHVLLHVLDFSKLYPEYLFIMDDESSEDGFQIWRYFIQDGKHYMEQGQIKFDPFDSTKLTEE